MIFREQFLENEIENRKFDRKLFFITPILQENALKTYLAPPDPIPDYGFVRSDLGMTIDFLT